MAEYIDKNKTIEFVKQQMISTNHGVNSDIYDLATRHALDWLSIISTVDVVFVVRCKDCKHFGEDMGYGKHDCKKYELPYCLENDYCSYGERKNDNGN